jgi:ornithine--oxo-acid transaminase
VLRDEQLVERAAEQGEWFLAQLRQLAHPDITDVRGRGLIAGIELRLKARRYCELLRERGMLCKETHDYVIRIAPPLVSTREDLEFALQQLRSVF